MTEYSWGTGSKVPGSKTRIETLLSAHLMARALLLVASWVVSAGILVYILLRTVQPYPLDAFEEYEIHKADRWTQGHSLYGSPGTETMPEAYPPLYFWLLGLWLHCFGTSFVAARSLSLAALAGIAACGWWAVRGAGWRSTAYGVFLTALLCFHPVSGKFYEVGKPDCLFTFLVAITMVCGEHRSARETTIGSLAMWLASLAKQNAPLFVIPLCLAHLIAGRWRWAFVWGTSMLAVIAGTYAVLGWATDGNFWHWTVTWTSSHGVSFSRGCAGLLEAIGVRGPVIAAVLIGTCAVNPGCRWTWCLIAAMGLALLGLAKAGGGDNHLLPAAFIAAVLLGRWVATYGPEIGVTRRDRLARWAVLAMFIATIWWGLPTRREFRWIGRRAEEVKAWTIAVRRLEGRVAVGHYWLLAQCAQAECFFSDLILEFRGLQVPESVRARIERQEFDYLLLSTNPQSSATAEWAELIHAYYEPAGMLDFANRSQVLPSRILRPRNNPVHASE